jgi:hypothetical protein
MFTKKKNLLVLAVLIPLTFGLILGGCKKDEEEDCPQVDYTQIDAKIQEAQTLHDGATEGTNPGEYEAGSKATLQTAIDNATQVRNKNCVTQQELDNATQALTQAIADFEDKKITQVAPENLVANYLMNGDATDASGNGHDGTTNQGYHLNGSGDIATAADRFGNADYAYQFSGGSNIEVPTSPDLNPADLSIVTWIKLDETWAHNYFVSLDIWNCWKFQVQDANKPFFTRKILKDDGSGENAWIDKDSNTGILENDTWTHIAMTYTSGHMRFYINGQETQHWDDFPTGTPVDPNPAVNMVIGQALPTSVYNETPGDPYEWKEWLGYLKGCLDDLKIYNITLTAAQVNSIYQYEKDNVME